MKNDNNSYKNGNYMIMIKLKPTTLSYADSGDDIMSDGLPSTQQADQKYLRLSEQISVK